MKALRPTSLAEKLSHFRKVHYTYLNVCKILTFWLQYFPRYEGSQIYTRERCAPARPKVTDSLKVGTFLRHSVNVCKISTFLFHIVPEILRGSQILRWSVIYSLKLVPYFGVIVHALLGLTEEGPS